MRVNLQHNSIPGRVALLALGLAFVSACAQTVPQEPSDSTQSQVVATGARDTSPVQASTYTADPSGTTAPPLFRFVSPNSTTGPVQKGELLKVEIVVTRFWSYADWAVFMAPGNSAAPCHAEDTSGVWTALDDGVKTLEFVYAVDTDSLTRGIHTLCAAAVSAPAQPVTATFTVE